MSTSKLFGKDILITSTTEAISNTVGAFSTLGGINVTKTILTAGGINSISKTNTLGNILIHTQPFIRIKVSFNFCH